MGKLIVIEGTDCSGKETQTNVLYAHMLEETSKVIKFSYPMYDTPTGKIVGGPYLGKKHISEGYFPEGAGNVDPKVAAAYYAADRKYNSYLIEACLDKDYDVILDRYVESNMAHQGGKISDPEKRLEMYKWLEQLEYGLYELPRPDTTIFLYMPHQYADLLKADREEAPDQHESNKEHILNAEKSFLELKSLYKWDMVDCVKETAEHTTPIKSDIYTPTEIHQKVYSLAKRR